MLTRPKANRAARLRNDAARTHSTLHAVLSPPGLLLVFVAVQNLCEQQADYSVYVSLFEHRQSAYHESDLLACHLTTLNLVMVPSVNLSR